MTPQRGFSNVPSVVRSLPGLSAGVRNYIHHVRFPSPLPEHPIRDATSRPRARTRRDPVAAAFFPTVSSSTDAASVATPAHARASSPTLVPVSTRPTPPRSERGVAENGSDLVESRTPDLVESASQWWSTFQSSRDPLSRRSRRHFSCFGR